MRHDIALHDYIERRKLRLAAENGRTGRFELGALRKRLVRFLRRGPAALISLAGAKRSRPDRDRRQAATPMSATTGVRDAIAHGSHPDLRFLPRHGYWFEFN